ncbi:bifunctional lysylphosphatidylglycerol flippase/synthetase MprF [Gordonia sp. ABSL49_1]|uniref:bifunctional lysylphosphatidylglycerol flippase/synthetase MprF n=1 Tax=Gordonia sp. ABSL49_1 TaxID=2920941 RepID=UPI001F0DC0EE|nr:DUF2156 domain-containing protein [Gordonia sp. ABSL49_1]MCH5644275.1 DUF2156 domain-containing protein [Gordonia sp. ABSL49_1]
MTTTEEQSTSSAGRVLPIIASGARRVPFTIVLFLLVLVAGIATGALWGRAPEKGWYADVAFGLPALGDGRIWTVFTAGIFEPSPGTYVVALLLIAVGLGWAEWRLGTGRAVLVSVGGLVGVELISAGVFWILTRGSLSWEWAREMGRALSVDSITMVVCAVAVASATLRSPWRLRLRALLVAAVSTVFLFEGTLASSQYVLATVVMLWIGERWFSVGEKGFLPRTRREVRLLACIGLVFIAVASLVVWFFPTSGPLVPTDAADDDSLVSMLIGVVINVLIADQLRRGKRWAWWVAVVVGGINVAVTVVVLVLIVFIRDVGAHASVTVGTTLLWAGVLAILIPGRFAFGVPWRVKQIGAAPGEEPVDQVKDLLREHGGGTMSWMITWPGNDYLFSANGTAVTTYQNHVGTLLALADPVCADDEIETAVRGFVDLAEHSGKIPCWFSVGARTAEVAAETGWRSVQIAEDTIVDLPGLEFTGKKWQHVRSALNKARKQDISFRLTTLPDESFAVKTQVRAISEEWLGDKGLPEMGFTLGSVEEALDPEVRVALAVDGDGSIHGVLSWLPVFGPGGVVRGWTLDIMRRRTDGFGPVIEYLIASSALEFKEQGAEFISLSGAPLAHSDDAPDAERMDRVLDTLGAALEPYYGFRSLHVFKKKFNPRYEPVYLVYRDEADLPRIGLAISRAYLPDATPAQMLRLARSHQDQ